MKNSLELAGEVVYAVSSILPEEGEDTVKSVEAAAEKPPEDLADSYAEGVGGGPSPTYTEARRFYP